MTNEKHELTADDLIVEYMIYKVKNGYEPSFFVSEFIDFLTFFESRMGVKDTLHDGKELFQRFFERKSERDWTRTKSFKTGEKETIPHMDIQYNKDKDDYLISANYHLSSYDQNIINTYFMPTDWSGNGKPKEIRNIIGEYLKDKPKRKIDEKEQIDEKELTTGKHIAAEIITNIWEDYIDTLIEDQSWPRQCKDINKFLFEMDLAEIIGTKSIKNELLELYQVLSKRIAILYHQDQHLKISSYGNIYLARANYKLLISGYEKIISTSFGEYKKSLKIDLSDSTFQETHEIPGVYYWDDDIDEETNTTVIGNNQAKKLVKVLDEQAKNIN